MINVNLNLPKKTVKIHETETDEIYMKGQYYQWKYLPNYTGVEVTMVDEIPSTPERKTIIISFDQCIFSITEISTSREHGPVVGPGGDLEIDPSDPR